MAGNTNSGRRPAHPSLVQAHCSIPTTLHQAATRVALAREVGVATVLRDVFWCGSYARHYVARAIDALREEDSREVAEAEGQILVYTPARRRRAEVIEQLFAFYTDLALGRDSAAWRLEVEDLTPEHERFWRKALVDGAPDRRAAAEAALREDLGRPAMVSVGREIAAAFRGALADDDLDADSDKGR